MRKFIKTLYFLLAVFSSDLKATVVSLTVNQINQHLGNLDAALGMMAAEPNVCFGFKSFMETAYNPGTPVLRVNTINRLRALLNSTNFSDNVMPILANTEFLSNRLMRLEIEHGNAIDNPRIAELRTLMVRINTPLGSASGILIPIPDMFNHGGTHHSWGILTCGHILEDISKEKIIFPVGGAEEFSAELNIGGAVIHNPILIHSIKIFKTHSLRIQNNDANVYENLRDNIVNAQDIRGIPRYEYPGDLALCYLTLTPDQINAINAEILPAPAAGHNYPHLQYDVAHHRISFQSIGGFIYSFNFVANDVSRDALVAMINLAGNKEHNFALGYPSYNSYVLTLSKARADAQIYPDFIDPTPVTLANPENRFMFFHDAPTYSGMSGGPILNTPYGNNEINIFGVIHGYNSPEPPDSIFANNPLQSRCSASFLL